MTRWIALCVVGVLSLIAGSVLVIVPVLPNGPHNVTPAVLETDARWYWVEINVTRFTVTSSVPFALDWSSSAALYLDYAVCSSPQSNFTNFFNSSSRTADCNEFYGAQGGGIGTPPSSLSMSVPPDGSVVLAWALTQYGPTNVSITYTCWSGFTYAPPALFTLGGVTVGIGAFGIVKAFRPGTPPSGGFSGRDKKQRPRSLEELIHELM